MIKEDKSTLYVRIRTTLHRRARIRALGDGTTLAKLIELALEKYLGESTLSAEETP